VEDKQAGRISGRTELTLDVMSVMVNGRSVDVNTQAVTQAGSSQTRRTGTMAGGGAALGAIIGAIAGGGKGAAIGAVSGAGAGAAAGAITKGSKVKIPSETRLTFTLQNPVRL
jgi:outer membrane lipoprotein SlyB